ncbi:MAG: divergent PAP2 family protein [Lachnospiraceae bacterium]|nr:divergent PAP2 family protein [Lachnospiraceae bacterium]
MDFLRSLFANKAFLAGLGGWAVAQVAKTIIYAIINKKFELERFVGAGGMPSCHSSMVCGLATATGMIYGGGSIEFAIALCFAIIVMYDAMNVRMETGRQGKILNDMIEIFQNMGKNISPEERLKELVGHTPLQVLIGALTGVIVAVIIVRFL